VEDEVAVGNMSPYQGQFTKRPSRGKDDFIVTRHREAFDGTGFAFCAGCAGANPSLREGKMFCSRNGAGGLITARQAQACDGTKPPRLD